MDDLFVLPLLLYRRTLLVPLMISRSLSWFPIAAVWPLLCTLLTALGLYIYIYIYTCMDDEPYVPFDHTCLYVYKFALE